ncbi:hypothetical protein [Streptomyces achromogenes]|uniref:hypothetical protein n=1 Tax=Streptomyces achromogenes TaxID=67255 RepID=UPI00342D6663
MPYKISIWVVNDSATHATVYIDEKLITDAAPLQAALVRNHAPHQLDASAVRTTLRTITG